MSEIEVTMDCEKCQAYQYEKGRADREKELQGIKDLGALYSEIRADERAKLLSLADCDNTECWNCAMCDGDMNCILKEQSSEDIKKNIEKEIRADERTKILNEVIEHLTDVESEIVNRRNTSDNLKNSQQLLGMQEAIEDTLGWLKDIIN